MAAISLSRSSSSSSFGRSLSYQRAMKLAEQNNQPLPFEKPSSAWWMTSQRRSCMCSPTTHPGSYRCSLHKNTNTGSLAAGGGAIPTTSAAVLPLPSSLSVRTTPTSVRGFRSPSPSVRSSRRSTLGSVSAARRQALYRSLARNQDAFTVKEKELIIKTVLAYINHQRSQPSEDEKNRKRNFKPRPSRLSAMSKASDEDLQQHC